MRRLIMAVMGVMFLSIGAVGQAQETVMITGAVESIAADGTSVVVNGQSIITAAEFLSDSEVMVGDEVAITAKKTAAGLEAIDYEYVFDESLFAVDSDTLDPVAASPASAR